MVVKGETYKERIEYQLKEWVSGNPIHNQVEDECCPDFSCCKPELLSPEDYRKTFTAANNEQREKMLFGFLGSALSELPNVHIVDGKNEIDSQLN